VRCKIATPRKTCKSTSRVATVRSEHGYWATKYDATPVRRSKTLRRQFGQKYDVKKVRNSHPVHLARAAIRWCKRHRTALRVYFLPGYSPELNPDECLNQDVKTNAVGRTRPLNREEMIGNVRAYLRSTQANRSLVKRYFQEEHVRYASV